MIAILWVWRLSISGRAKHAVATLEEAINGGTLYLLLTK